MKNWEQPAPDICRAVDIHTHIVPETLPAYTGVDAGSLWPSVCRVDSCHANVVVDGKIFRKIDDACWNSARRVASMAEMSVARQVLSPMPELLSYWLPARDAVVLARCVNECIAEMVRNAPDRFFGLGMIPLQDLDLAIAELEFAMGPLGLSGVEIGTNILGEPVGSRAFDPFFVAAERLGASVFVHPLRPTGMDRLIGPPSLEQVVAFPNETAFAIASLMTSGALAAFPRLRFAFSHGGGGFAQLLPRLQRAWTILPALQAATIDSPDVLARRLFYDTAIFSASALRFLIEQFGASQIVIGTDYPFHMDAHPLDIVFEAGVASEEVDALTWQNALRFLGRAASQDGQ